MSLAFNSPAQAADCGGTVPCACGDNLVANRKLVSSDPVVVSACSGNGLIMNTSGVVLDLGNTKILGEGNGVGVLISANGVTIKNGKIDSFAIGIATADGTTTTGSRLDKVKPLENTGDGIYLVGDDNDLIGILSKHNGNRGVVVIGDKNLLQGHNDEYNEFDGIYVQGDENILMSNLASENAESGTGSGMIVIGNSNIIQKNTMSKLNRDGITVLGHNNSLTGNKVSAQRHDGITVNGDGNILKDNNSFANLGTGIIVVGNGSPAASSGNSVSKNRVKPQCTIYGSTGLPACKN